MPRSATSLTLNCAGMVLALTTLVLYRAVAPLDLSLLVLLAYIAPIALGELIFLKVHRRASSGLDFRKVDWNTARVYIKLLGFYATLAGVTFFYWLLPEFADAKYAPYWSVIYGGWPLLVIPYFIAVDCVMVDPKDGYWQMGLLVVGRWHEIDRKLLAKHALEYAIKAFFLPIMFLQLVDNVTTLTAFAGGDLVAYYDAGFTLLYLIDVIAVVTGYVLTTRLVDSHVRTIEPTLGGWLICLVCYGAFWPFLWTTVFNYERSALQWGRWLNGYPSLQIVWGCAVLFFTGLYALAHLHFGLRFSNLTNRGILTSGLYRWTKHPSYVAKNISWWLISVPFIATNSADAVRNCLLLAAVNLVYFVRARTEERHLSSDPVYVEYALAMNQKSVFAGLARLFPFLAYRPPATSPLKLSVLSTGRK
jgi:isoprenylcysteine carboxyl methyltransferase (ICMT) family protein YpbQ